MDNTGIAFVIMQIGNNDLDRIYSEVFIPVIKNINLVPKRIDQDNEGHLLKKEIIEFIEKAEIIIADLTNERPNCYLEIGYAMGLGKFTNLIFTVREDHFPEDPNYVKGGPKIHFDLGGYDILFWSPTKLDEFKSNLSDKINRRLATINVSNNLQSFPQTELWDKNWLDTQRALVKESLTKFDINRYVEILISPLINNIIVTQQKLLQISEKAQITEHNGWPIGVVINIPEYRPIPKVDGIVSKIDVNLPGPHFSYTYFKKNGQIYTSKLLFEERSHKKLIITEVRIKRTTELLLYTARFYSGLDGITPKDKIKITINYYGLLNNSLIFEGPTAKNRISHENEITLEITTSLNDIENKLPELVYELIKSFFVLFDYYDPGYDRVKHLVNQFVMEITAKRS